MVLDWVIFSMLFIVPVCIFVVIIIASLHENKKDQPRDLAPLIEKELELRKKHDEELELQKKHDNQNTNNIQNTKNLNDKIGDKLDAAQSALNNYLQNTNNVRKVLGTIILFAGLILMFIGLQDVLSNLFIIGFAGAALGGFILLISMYIDIS